MKICPQCMRQYGDEVDVCEDDGSQLRTFRDQAARMVGQVLDGRWEIEEKIAEGGMGEVYRARQVTMERVVAIKLIRSGLAGSGEFVARFFREANILATIQHPHFVTIYDYGQAANEVLYIAMEFLKGESLGERMASSRLGLSEIVKVGAQICAALDVAHQNQVVHRDLKPDNVFLVDVPDDVFVKVLDFGIAKQLDSDHTPVTRTGQVFGTPEYMSPEQCEAVDLVDQRSDLYSLGVILYELLTGTLPYDGKAAIKIMVAKISDPAIPIAEHGVTVPKSLEELVHELLEMKRDDRPQSAAETRQRLEAIFDELRENPESVELFGKERLAASERIEDGETRRLDNNALDGRRARLQREMLDSRKIAFDDSKEIPFAEMRAASTPEQSRGIALFVVLGIVLLASVAIAVPDVRQVVMGPFVEESDPVPLGPSPQDVERSFEAAESAVVASASVAERKMVERESAALAERVKFDAAVFAASLPGSSPEPIDDPLGSASGAPLASAQDGAPSDRVKPKPAGVLSFRTTSSIDRKVKRYEARLLPCYEARADASLEGAISFEFRIDPEGEVDYFEMTQNDFDDGVKACAEEEVRSWTFGRGVQGSGFDTHRRTVTFRKSR